eukprot:bmy_07846T0
MLLRLSVSQGEAAEPYREAVGAEVAGEERGRILQSLCYSSQRGGLLVGVPTSPPRTPTATRTPSSACECDQGQTVRVPQSPSGAHLSRAAPELTPFFPISYLHPNGGKKSKYKTSVRKKTPNPEFNEEFPCAGPREELAQKTLLVSVWDDDPGTADDFTGGVQLSSRARGERQQHWRECLGRSDHQLELWHPLDGMPLQLSD